MLAARLCYSGQLSAADWSRKHAVGTVPDAFPYGLDRMSKYGVDVYAPEPPSGMHRLAMRVGRKLFDGYEWRGDWSKPGEFTLCWDERVGIPAAVRSQGPIGMGVIWLTEPDRRRPGSDLLARRALSRADTVWALSRAQLEPLARWGANDARWLPFGIDADFWTPEGDSDPEYIVSAGNDRHRDHATLVNGVESAVSMSGRGRLLLASRRDINVPPRLGKRVDFLPHDVLRSEYRRAQVVAIATKPNLHCSGITAILEAMACGRPVVATDTPGMRDYVRHGTDGFLVPPGDPAAFGTAIAELISDVCLANRMGHAGRERIESHFTTEILARELAGLVREHS